MHYKVLLCVLMIQFLRFTYAFQTAYWGSSTCLTGFERCRQEEYIIYGKGGMPGPKGDRGPSGNSNCAPSVIISCTCDQKLDALRSKLDKLMASLATKTSTSAQPTTTTTLQTSPKQNCFDSLGVEFGGYLQDSSFKSSGHASKREAHVGRLNTPFTFNAMGGWMPWPVRNSWLQVDLGSIKYVSRITMQGNAKYSFYTEEFTLKYGESETSLHYAQDSTGKTQVFKNKSKSSITHQFNKLLLARYIRVYPIEYFGSPYIRFGLRGCDY